MNASHITARRGPFGHWSAHFAGQPWPAFGGDTPQTAAIRLLTASPDGPQHILATDFQSGQIEFTMA